MRQIYSYRVFEERLSLPDCGAYSAYGIAAYAVGSGRTAARVADISTDKRRVDALAAKFNRLALRPVHLRDVVEDFLAE
jgi:hypothetical protein